MKKQKLIMGIFLAVLVTLAACGNTSDESNAKLDKQLQKKDSIQNINENTVKEDSKENASNTVHNNTTSNSNGIGNNHSDENVDTSNHVIMKGENYSINNTPSLKEVYLKKLNDAKKEVEEIRKNSGQENTYALKKVEGDRYDIWDGLLNEVYSVLKKQLSTEEMEQLRLEERKWLESRESAANKESLKYKGGTLEWLEYRVVLNNYTEERCFELVEDYMK